MMKNGMKFGIMVVLTSLVIASCEKEDNFSSKSIEGTYVGTLTVDEALKSVVGLTDGDYEATAEVTHMGEGLLEIHFYGNDLDTTFMLNYYAQNDSLMVCLTGDEFENQYGHMLGQGHMSGGMMGDKIKGETEWMHHMSDEHDDGEEHFGGFDMNMHTFSYRFMMMDDNNPYFLNFQGQKK